MKLYYKPGACSLSPHIVLEESGLAYDKEAVDLATKKTASGADFFAVNPKGSVPALQLDDGQVLTEGAVIVQYLADRVPDRKLAPPTGSMERYRLMEWLNYTASDLHKNFGFFFNPKATPEMKDIVKEVLARRLEAPAKVLAGKSFLMGDGFTVADAYLFTILGWAPHVGLDLAAWPSLQAYLARVAARPAVRAVMVDEGLVTA